jgi:hypothetical protein
MARKKSCKTVITQSMYDRICDLYAQYRKARVVEGIACADVFDLYKVMNAELHMHKSERTLRRIYRREYDRSSFPA